MIAAQLSLPAPATSATTGIVAGSVAGGIVLAVVGVALGFWLNSQIGALAVAAVVFLAVGPVALLIDPRVYALLPADALDSMVGQRAANPALLTAPAAAALLGCHVIVVLLAAAHALSRRAVT